MGLKLKPPGGTKQTTERGEMALEVAKAIKHIQRPCCWVETSWLWELNSAEEVKDGDGG